MTVNSNALLSQTYHSVTDLGRKASVGDAVLVIDGHEEIQLLFKQFPWAVATVKDAMETFGPNGQLIKQPQNTKTAFEGPVGIYEVIGGKSNAHLLAMIESGAQFNATAYHGRPHEYTEKQRLEGAFLVMDVADRDWETDAPLLLQGTLHYHYFAGVVK